MNPPSQEAQGHFVPPKHMLPSFLALAEQGVRQLADPPLNSYGGLSPPVSQLL